MSGDQRPDKQCSAVAPHGPHEWHHFDSPAGVEFACQGTPEITPIEADRAHRMAEVRASAPSGEHGRSRFDCDGLREASRTIASPGASSWMLAAADEIDRLRFTAPSADTADLIERLHAAADTATGPMIRLLLAEAADTLAAASGEHGDTASVPKAEWERFVRTHTSNHDGTDPNCDACSLIRAATEGGAS